MPTQTDIANAALVKLGEGFITSLDDGTVTALACKARIDSARRSVLRAHPWNCAMHRATLAALSTTPAFDYSNEFQQPSDFIRVIRVDCGETDYRVEGKKILANESTLDLRYVYDAPIEDIGDDLLLDSIASYLAWDLSYKITGKDDVRNSTWAMFQGTIRSAKSVDAQEEPGEDPQADDFLNSRF